MIYRRYAHALIPVYDSVYAIGGFYHQDKPGVETRSLSSVERFNIVTQEWEEVCSMETSRAFFGACAIQD